MYKLLNTTLAVFLSSVDPSISIAQSLELGSPAFTQGLELSQPDWLGPATQQDGLNLYQEYVNNTGRDSTRIPTTTSENESFVSLLQFYNDFTSDVFQDDGRRRISFFEQRSALNPTLAIQNGGTSILFSDIVRLSKSVALVTATNNVSPTVDGQFMLQTNLDNLCEEVRFSGSLIAGHCTAFLAFDQQTIVTANHCIPDQADYSVVFNFSSSHIVSSDLVFQIDHTSKSLQSVENDLAILKLDRPVPKDTAEPLVMSAASQILENTRVGIIGHPMGMGKMVEFGSESRVKQVLGNHFLTNNDAFHGNSGSPVFDQETLMVEGILQRGQFDLVKDIDRNCNTIRTVDADGADGSGLVLGFQTALMASKAAELHRDIQ